MTEAQRQFLLNHGFTEEQVKQLVRGLGLLKQKAADDLAFKRATKSDEGAQRPFWQAWADGETTAEDELAKTARAAQARNAAGWPLPIFHDRNAEKAAGDPSFGGQLRQMILDGAQPGTAARKSRTPSTLAQMVKERLASGDYEQVDSGDLDAVLDRLAKLKGKTTNG